jgi:carbon storage regulator
LRQEDLMLVLSRKLGERIVIGDDVVVEVVRITGNKVTLGFVAPTETKIWRGEILGGRRGIVGDLAGSQLAIASVREPGHDRAEATRAGHDPSFVF